jgi:hypothetical protein
VTKVDFIKIHFDYSANEASHHIENTAISSRTMVNMIVEERTEAKVFD